VLYRIIFTLSFLVIFQSSLCFSGQISLDNGDVLQGEISGITANDIIWSSALFGSLTIPKSRVIELVSAIPVKLNARKGACYWAGMSRRQVRFECDQYGEFEQSLVSVKDVVKYDGGQGTFKERRGKVTASGSREEGNVNKQDWAMDTNVFFRYREYRHDIWLKYWAESREQEELKNRVTLNYQFDWFFAPKTFWSTNLELLQDDPLRISQRASIGTGLGYQFWENTNSSLSLETGPEYVSETTFAQNDTSIETTAAYASWRLAGDFRIKLPRDIVLFSKVELLQSLESGDDWEMESNTGLSLPIAGGVTADLSYRNAFDSSPPEGQDESDTRLRLGVGYQW
jgi:putative salt-induced outer membrane protein YdiY